jgi:hypothetical protein
LPEVMCKMVSSSSTMVFISLTGQEVTVLADCTALATSRMQGSPPHSVLDIPAVSLGPELHPLTGSDDLLGEMLEGRL